MRRTFALVARSLAGGDHDPPSPSRDTSHPETTSLRSGFSKTSGRCPAGRRAGGSRPAEVVLVALGHRPGLGEARVVEALPSGSQLIAANFAQSRQSRRSSTPSTSRTWMTCRSLPPLRERVGDERAVFARDERRQRRRAVGAQRVGIEEHARLAVDPVLHVEDGLVLQTGVAREEVPAASLDRDARCAGSRRARSARATSASRVGPSSDRRASARSGRPPTPRLRRSRRPRASDTGPAPRRRGRYRRHRHGGRRGTVFRCSRFRVHRVRVQGARFRSSYNFSTWTLRHEER